jgi:hypothetical protein
MVSPGDTYIALEFTGMLAIIIKYKITHHH